jgi:uncharacterized membrane protein
MTTTDTGRLERWLARVLGVGAALSATLLAAGLLLELFGAQARAATALEAAGLVILMATPVVRVAASVVDYVLDRDWLFATLTGIVLATLLASLLVAEW